ncbi:MAG TPA: hypothetical protein VNJ02_05695 [Vicinamibacterales bacterium]|nr:hypothetical protein [Vicinamibacterales bacterium]
MADTDASTRLRLLLAVILALSLIVLVIHVAMVRPFLWPAGAGLAVSGDTVFTSNSEPRAVPRIRPPDLKTF